MADQKTSRSTADPNDYIAAIGDDGKRADAERVLELMAEATNQQPAMWGTGMVGFGSLHYRYATGREGDTMKVGFAARKSALTLYGLRGHPRSEELLAALGPHTLGKGCVYVKRLSDVDEKVLRELVSHAYQNAGDVDARSGDGRRG